MPFIQNCAALDVRYAQHNNSNNGVLIQISLPKDQHGSYFPDPWMEFSERYQFEFDDQEDIRGISKEQAKDIVNILKRALENNKNVIVHCYAGISRSGAVAEFAVSELGFENKGDYDVNTINKRVYEFLRSV